MWRDAGYAVRYVQNVTDLEDPLRERAERDGEDWIVLAMRETALFREDMTALRVLPPDDYVGAVESIPGIVVRIEDLLDAGLAYVLDDGTGDASHDVSHAPGAGLRGRLPLRRADEAAVLRRTRGSPRPRGQAQPAGSAPVARRTARRAVLARPAGGSRPARDATRRRHNR